jgi:CBS domain-containing protein
MSLRALASKALARPAVESSASGRTMHAVSRKASLAEALSMMTDLKIGSLLVGTAAGERTTEGAALIEGILTERDILDKLDFEAPLDQKVESLMTPASELTLANGTWDLEAVLRTMQRGHFRHLPFVSAEDGSVTSMVSMRDVARALASDASAAAASGASGLGEVAAAAAVTAADVLRARSRSVRLTPVGTLPSSGSGGPPSCIEVEPAATVAEAVLEMRRGRAGSVLIPVHGGTIRESRHGFGIFTERDYLRLLGSAGRSGQSLDARTVPISSVMTAASAVRYVTPDKPAYECLEVLAQEDIRHLPVMQPPLPPPSEAGKAAPASPTDSPRLIAVLSMRDLLSRFLRSGPG